MLKRVIKESQKFCFLTVGSVSDKNIRDLGSFVCISVIMLLRFVPFARVRTINLRLESYQGKTLAFVLPILESLTNGPAKTSRKTGYGRAPSVLVLLPTRELATQVCIH